MEQAQWATQLRKGSISPRGAETWFFFFFFHCLALIFDALVPEHPEINCKMAKDGVLRTKPFTGQVGSHSPGSWESAKATLSVFTQGWVTCRAFCSMSLALWNLTFQQSNREDGDEETSSGSPLGEHSRTLGGPTCPPLHPMTCFLQGLICRGLRSEVLTGA